VRRHRADDAPAFLAERPDMFTIAALADPNRTALEAAGRRYRVERLHTGAFTGRGRVFWFFGNSFPRKWLRPHSHAGFPDAFSEDSPVLLRRFPERARVPPRAGGTEHVDIP
jgi:hypothetical protein